MNKKYYPVPKPTPPTEEEIAAFELWKPLYEAAVKKGERRGWLSYHPYCDGAPEPWSPTDRHQADLREWKAARSRWLQEAKKREEAALQVKADLAADEARARVLRGEVS